MDLFGWVLQASRGVSVLAGSDFGADIAGVIDDARAAAEAGVGGAHSATRVLALARSLAQSGRVVEYSGHSAALSSALSVRERLLPVAASGGTPACAAPGPAGGPSEVDEWIAATARSFPGSAAFLRGFTGAPEGVSPRDRLVWPLMVRAAARADDGMAAAAWELMRRRLELVMEAGGSLAAVGVPGAEGYVHPDVLAEVYALGVRHGGEEALAAVRAALGAVDDAAETDTLLGSLAAASSEAGLASVLALAVEDGVVRSQDVVGLVGDVARSSPLGRQLAWEFVRTRAADIDAKVGRVGAAGAGLSSLVVRVAGGFADEARVAEVERLRAEHPDWVLESAVAKVADLVARNARWIADHAADVCDWVRRHPPGP